MRYMFYNVKNLFNAQKVKNGSFYRISSYLFTCLHVKLIDSCLVTSYDASHECGTRIDAIQHV